jgi:hypothetical protein
MFHFNPESLTNFPQKASLPTNKKGKGALQSLSRSSAAFSETLGW